MPELTTLLLFSVAALALTSTPGPDMLLIASRSAAQGRMAGFATWCGAAVGTYVHAMAAALGLSQLFLVVPAAYEVVRWLGAAYLLYLAWTIFAAQRTENTTLDKTNVAPRTNSFVQIFWQGFFTNLLNPKMVLFVLAFFPQFIDVSIGSVGVQIMIFATIINIVGFVVNGLVILAASGASTMLVANPAVSRYLNYFLGLVFVGLATRLMLDEN